MSTSVKSSVTSTLKPRNIFYIWYTELCRRSNCSPLTVVKPARPKSDVVLDFTGDRIKCNDWIPILQALSLDTSLHVISIKSRHTGVNFHYEINSEEKARKLKKPMSLLWTDYLLRNLSKSLGNCLKNSEVISCLELEGVPMYMEYLELLMKNMKNNRSIKVLSLKRCHIRDGGCKIICTYLRLIPNLSVINLSSCDLSSVSGQYIAKIIRHQQINRYSESWHNSLRYEEPDSEPMGGIKRLSLNNNPDIGDEGLEPILDALDDDLWIKAIDMQNCNVSENMSRRIISLVEQNTNLEVADFRNNANLTLSSVETILETFEKKYRLGNNPEFQWGETSTSICDTSFSTTCSTFSGLTGRVHKTKSATLKHLKSELSSTTGHLRPTRTQSTLDQRSRYSKNVQHYNNPELSAAKKQLSELHHKLQAEISKRIKTEQANSELQKQLVSIRQLDNIQHDRFLTPEKVTKITRVIENLKYDEDKTLKNSNSKISVASKLSKNKNNIKSNADVRSSRNYVASKSYSSTTINKTENKSINNKRQIVVPKINLRPLNKCNKHGKNMPPIYEIPSQHTPVDDATVTARTIFAKLLLQNHYKHRIEERTNYGNIQCETGHADVTLKSDRNGGDVSSFRGNDTVQNDKSLEILYRELDAVDQELNLNCISGFNT
ncbi:hypothetical protein FQR65_LT11445 [Abscondita terminalis]|nr:hypothetical protein FQR65_LT11445 [Abscondita terminalis]